MDAPLPLAELHSRITYVINDIMSAGLRTIFKQEWDNLYKDNLGEWKDQPKNGMDFLEKEKDKGWVFRYPFEINLLHPSVQYLATVSSGNRNQWDAATLFYGILCSKCIGHNLYPVVRESIEKLFKIRRKALAGLLVPSLSLCVGILDDTLDAFTALGLSTQQIQEIKNLTKSPISELNKGDDPNKEDTESLFALMKPSLEAVKENEPLPVLKLAKGFVIDSMFSVYWIQIHNTLRQLAWAGYEDEIDKMTPLKELLKHWKLAEGRIMAKLNELDSMVKGSAEEGSDGVTHGYRPDTDSPLKAEEAEIVEASMKFEAEHEECVRVLPYKENDQVVIRFYVFSGESGALERLKLAAQECFTKMKVEPKWLDLYNNAANVLNVTPLKYVCGESHELALEASQVDAISEVINENLSKFDKHRNVTSVQASFKVKNSRQTREPCIRIYVLGKGFIPMGESKFETSLGPYPVDVVDGFWYSVGARKIWEPKQAQKQKDVVCLGASIGVKDEGGCGTLGAIVGDGDRFYALSCDHVVKHGPIVRDEIVHPGLDDHLNYLRYHLRAYAQWIDRITEPGNQETKITGAEKLQKLEMEKKFNRLMELKEANRCSERCSEDLLEEAEKHEKAFQAGLKEPRLVGLYTKGLKRNVKWTNDKEYFIDAAIAELTKDEVERLKKSKTVKVIGTGVPPSGECCPVKDIMRAKDLCKSGRTTGYTENGFVVGDSVDAPAFLAAPMFKAQGGATFNVKLPHAFCPECDTGQTSQSQMEPVHGMTCYCKTCKKKISNVVCEPEWRKNCLFVDARKQFVDEGDSGAVIFEKRGEGTGLRGFGVIFAMHENAYKIYAIASPLEVVLDALSSEISEDNVHTLQLVSEFNS